MRFFLFSLMASAVLILPAPSELSAEQLAQPFFARHGVVDPRIAAYLPPFEKKTASRHWRRGYDRLPYYGFYRDNRLEQKRTSPPAPAKTVYKEPRILNPAIFDPPEKTPLTLIVEDGVVVDRYQGY